MKFGIVPVNIGLQSAQQMVGLAQAAEQAGFESAWTFEHVIVPLNYQSKYPYNASGKMGARPETAFIDPLIALSAIATATSTLKLATGINILPQANPLFLAKQAASLDFVSNGRFMLGLGVGWLREEFDAMGTPFERRGIRFDDYLEGMKKVWSGEVVEHESEFINWHGFKSYPLPVQKPHLPIIIGGGKGKTYQRIARHGDGWYAIAETPEDMARDLAELRAVCDEVGRDFSEIEITTWWNGKGGEELIRSMADVGVHRLLIMTTMLGKNPLEGIQQFAEKYDL